MATPRRRVALRAVGGVAAALAIFGLAGYFGGPPLIKYLVERNATEALGRKVTLGGAHVRPFELAATLNDLTIFEPDGKTPMLTLGSVEANTSAASVPLALSVATADGRIKQGDLVMLEAMGGGFTWGATLIRW